MLVERVTLPGLDRVTFLGGMTGASELAVGPYADRTGSPSAQMSLALGRSFSPRDLERLHAQRRTLVERTEEVLARTPILAMPTTAIPPPALSRGLVANEHPLLMLRALGAFTPLANLVDLPSIAVPCGVDDVGRPLSIMFTGARGSETTLLRIALAVEQTGLGRTGLG